MSGVSWREEYRLGLDFGIFVGNLDRKIGYNVSREESSHLMLNRDIIDGASNICENVYFDIMAIPGKTYKHFMKYWRKLEKEIGSLQRHHQIRIPLGRTPERFIKLPNLIKTGIL